MPLSLRDTFPFRLLIGQEDVTFLLDEGGTFSNADPGGFEAASFNIPKDMPATIRGLPVRLDSGLGVAWEGRVSQVQRSLGSRSAIVCEGYGARFKDAAGSMVFVDRDLTRFTDASYTRQAALLSSSLQYASSQVAADPSNLTPALIEQITDSWTAPFKPINEAWYDAGPENLIAKVYYNVYAQDDGSANWGIQVMLSDDAQASTTEASGNLWLAAGAASIGYFSPATAYRFALLQHLNGLTPSGQQGGQYNAYWRHLAAYGNHGLTGRGADPVGFYPSDIFDWVVSQVPGIQAGIIQQTDATGYIIPHSAYYTEVNLDQIAGDMGTIQGWHWGVWPSLTPLTGNATPRADFQPRPAPGSFTAFCQRSACDTLDIREDLSQQYNRCVTTFTDVAGVQGAVVVTVDNPVLDAAGIAVRTLTLDGGTMDPSTAGVFALETLVLTNVQAKVAGTASIVSAIDFPSGPGAPWMLQSGHDRLRIGDAPSTDAFGTQSDYPISRVECSLSSGGITTAVEIGQGSNLIETMQARLAAANSLAGNGG